jgi:hypothetical protein
MPIPGPDSRSPNPAPARPHPPPIAPAVAPPGVPPPSPGPAGSAKTRVEPCAFVWLKRIVVIVACTVGAVASATAQSSNGGEELVPADPCQAKPGDHSEDPTVDTSREALPSENTLEHCKGVLTPPKIGDHEIEEPPPNTGTTRIIRPGDIPEQAPN